MRIHLLQLGPSRFELYAEPVETVDEPPAHDAGRIRHALHRAGEEWRSLVDTARLDQATSWWAKARDAVICKLADSIDEQKTMWSLRTTPEVDVWFPASLSPDAARTALFRRLVEAQRFHGVRLVVYLALFVASGILFFVPGPNIVAYYLGFQAFGHLQSWRGARRGVGGLQWTLVPNDDLAELARLAQRPRAERERGVSVIAERLGLPRLSAFFERAVA